MVVSSVDSGPRRIAPSEPHDTERGLSMLNQSTISPAFGDSRLPPRFWAKVRIGSIPTHRPDLGPCWEWTASQVGNGYGQFGTWTGNGNNRAHRVAYTSLVGPIPAGLQSDHLCRNRLCVNPEHLELVTLRENVLRGEGPAAQHARKTHCPKGHPYDEKNTYLLVIGNGVRRYCRACKPGRDRLYRLRRKARKGE